MESSNYRERLFDLLPQLYHIYDEGNGSLKAFLEAVGETLDDMERNIAELYGDGFIETCNEWVVPYLGQLIGARLLDRDGNRNRQEVMKTIRWRKRKGNPAALEDLANEITGWGARAAEFLEQTGWSQNLNHLKPDHLQSPDLRDHKMLARLGTAGNRILHTIDPRCSCGRKGWFQIKNIGFFLSPAALSHYRKIPMRRVAGQPQKFGLEPTRFPVELFDGTSRFPLGDTVAAGERIDSFGTGQTIDVFSQGVLAATSEMPKWTGSPAAAPPHADILNLKDHDGVLPVDWEVEGGEPLEYIITPLVLFEKNNKAELKELGHLDLSVSPLKFTKTYDGSSEVNGRLVIQVAPKPGVNRAFPPLVLKLQSASQTCQVFAGLGDRQRGIYQDRLYCYVPEFCPAAASRDVIIDRYGSAYSYTHDGTQGQPSDADLYDFTGLARATEGVVYPSRKLTTSTAPFRPIYSLAKIRAVQIIDRGQFFTSSAPAAGWTIKAWNRDNQPGGGVLRLLSAVKATSLADRIYTAALEDHAVDSPGHLVLSLHHPATGKIPEMEIVVTDERGTSVLAYLPQIDNLDSAGAFFYVTDDGATYRVNGDPVSGGIVVKRTPQSGPGGAFNRELLGRYSAGQVLPIEGKSPIQQRIATRCDLSKKTDVQPGLLAVDPATGHIKFAKGERPRLPITASYYHGLSFSLGAGPYFHEWDQVTDGYGITTAALDDLRSAGLSETVLTGLKIMENQRFGTESAFLDAIKNTIGTALFNSSKSLIQKYSESGRLIRVSKTAAPDGTRHLRPPEEGIVSSAPIFSTIEEGVHEAIHRSAAYSQKGPLVVRIEDSAFYAEDFTITEPVLPGLVIRAAEFQRPRWEGSMIWQCPDTVFMDHLSLEGLLIARTPEIKSGRFGEIVYKDCSLLKERLILNDVVGREDRYPKLTIDNCITRDRISVHCPCEISIANSALDPDDAHTEALVAEKSPVRLERCTVTGAVRVKELFASESIFMKTASVVDPQKGCVRYSRISEGGNTLPLLYKCTTGPAAFCSNHPWKSNYLKLKRTCRQDACTWAENGGEIGAYHQALYTLKTKNLMMKFEEYLPVGLTPVLIDTGCD